MGTLRIPLILCLIFLSHSCLTLAQNKCDQLLLDKDRNNQLKFASDYKSAEHAALFKNTQQLLKYYLQAKSEEDPQINFLEELGFNFDPEHLVVPSPQSVFKKVDSMLLQIQREYNLTSDQVYRPARSFVNQAGEVLWLKSDEEVPRGFSAKTVSLDSQQFKNLKLRGLFPLSEIRSDGKTISALSFFMHDLGHLGVYIRDPEFMIYDRALARVQRGELFEEYLSENLIWVNRKFRKELQECLSRHNVYFSPTDTLSENVKNKISQFTLSKLNSLVADLVRNKFRWFVALGGFHSSIVDPRNRADRTYALVGETTGLNSFFSSFYLGTNRNPLTLEDFLSENRWMNEKQIRDSIANYISIIIIMMDYSPGRFYYDLANPNQKSQLMNSLLFKTGSEFFPEHMIFFSEKN